MAMFGALQAAGSGLNVFRTWIEATSNNVANLQSVNLTPGGEPFKTELVIATSASSYSGDSNAHGARVVDVVKRDEIGRPKYEPEHPLADPVTGEVTYPGVDMGEQMVNMVVAQRGYQANVTIMQYARDAYQSALRLGR